MGDGAGVSLVECVKRNVPRVSDRVAEVSRMYDMPLEAAAAHTVRGEVPGPGQRWGIGAIVGPSGSGKSVIARRAFGARVVRLRPWPRRRAVLDGFADHPLERITATLTAVGLGSPPAWLRAYRQLSTGERFRCDLARALLESGDPVVFDEFGCPVDRQARQMAASAIARGVRGGTLSRRFVAVTCHEDVLPWLAPDWVLDMATGELSWGWVHRRAPFELEITRCAMAAWSVFEPHHYLSSRVHPAARCYAAWWQDQPVAFCATLNQAGVRRMRRISRLVVLPRFQGLGIGRRMADSIAAMEAAEGFRIRLVTGHQVFASALTRHPRWQMAAIDRRRRPHRGALAGGQDSQGRQRMQFSFEWQPALPTANGQKGEQ